MKLKINHISKVNNHSGDFTCSCLSVAGISLLLNLYQATSLKSGDPASFYMCVMRLIDRLSSYRYPIGLLLSCSHYLFSLRAFLVMPKALLPVTAHVSLSRYAVFELTNQRLEGRRKLNLLGLVWWVVIQIINKHLKKAARAQLEPHKADKLT